VNRFERVLERATTVTTASSERIEEGSMSFEYANLLLSVWQTFARGNLKLI
jgi:hypothetical protein